MEKPKAWWLGYSKAITTRVRSVKQQRTKVGIGGYTHAISSIGRSNQELGHGITMDGFKAKNWIMEASKLVLYYALA